MRFSPALLQDFELCTSWAGGRWGRVISGEVHAMQAAPGRVTPQG